MKELKTEIEIAAPIDKVWNALIDINHWKDWNPVSHGAGEAKVGAKLSVQMLDENGKAGAKYKPEIIELEDQKTLRWRAVMMAGFLFTNIKVFELEETAKGTRLIHKELFDGLLVPLFWSKLNSGVSSMLNSTNKALKKAVEDNI